MFSKYCFHGQETLTDLGLGHHRGLAITEWWERQAQLCFFVPLETQEEEKKEKKKKTFIDYRAGTFAITLHRTQLFDTASGFLHWFHEGKAAKKQLWTKILISHSHPGTREGSTDNNSADDEHNVDEHRRIWEQMWKQ